ncbi:hypothetical protein F0A16_02895 [Salinicola corii]|uniref:Uncharacterized protein n=1 Tax=Salinicola corii TaxID=2606937 RepID=A0A640WJP2_9GAMM|nr:hypothetical protein [Salinicola corii]KAA0020752.1 hypothetical protein F0A16_02895 [Salinicola corii]
MSTVERDLADYERRVDDRARYDLALGRQTDDLIDMLRRGHGFMNCNRGEAISRVDEDEITKLVTDLALAEQPSDIEAATRALRRVVYDEISGMCREVARRELERREAA